jgi:hypothetical protein
LPQIAPDTRAPSGQRETAILLLIGWASALIGIAVLVAGGISFRIGDIPVRAHSPASAFVVAAVCAAIAWRRGTAHVGRALEWWWTTIERRASLLALAAAGLAVAIGAVWGTYVAGGPDSYCYLNQAEMLAAGRVSQPQPIVARAPWPDAPMTFAPVGHLPAPPAKSEPSSAIVPACPTGYPLLLAAARLAGGRAAMFWVVPVFGGIAVWLTFVLGRRVGGAVTGVAAAWLFAASPTFLYQITQPMTDVPAVALWTAALVSLMRQPDSLTGGLRSGLLIGAALLVRPNLVPLVAITVCAVLLPERTSLRGAFRVLTATGLGLLPFLLIIMALNNAMFGGPLQSGYGKLAELFTLAHVRGNLERYPVWLVQTQTPFVLLAFVAPWVARRGEPRRVAWWLLAFALAAFACYIPYTVWDAWWFLRFVLPAFPPLLVLSAAVAVARLGRLPAAWRTAIFATSMSLLVGFQIVTAEDRAVFRLRELERRFRDAGEYVARRLPANAVVFAVTESGSVRFYSGRQTLRWSFLDPAWLDRAMESLKADGYRPFFLFELDEEPEFREKFGHASRWGSLGWPPLADINRQVHIYDPADYDRYLRGETVRTDDVWRSGR